MRPSVVQLVFLLAFGNVASALVPDRQPLLRRRGGIKNAMSGAPSTATSGPLVAAVTQTEKAGKPERALQATAFLFVVGVSLIALAPAPHLIAKLGEKQGLYLLTAVASTSAAAEIALSPIIGGLSDSFGRKPVLLGTLCCALLANLAAAISPSVPLVVLSKFVASIVVGFFFLAGGAFLADNYRQTPKRLAAVSGVLFALVNLGFSLGIALSGAPFIPSSLQGKYACSVGMCTLALLVASFGVRESLPAEKREAFKARSFNPLAFTRLLSASPRMRSLGILTALASAPMFMGDVLQVFAIRQWELTQPQVVQLFTGVALSGVLANVFGGTLIKALGIRPFNLVASICSVIFWGGFASASLRLAVVCAACGFLGQARTLSATTMMTAEGSRLGIPQGELSGDRANMIAWLKIIGPLIYGQLAAHGRTAGVPTAPFVLNMLLAMSSAVLGTMTL